MSRDKAIFQSTRPMRGATCLLRRCLFRQEFQSTRPMRGATWEQDCSGERYCISIHAPHAGRDDFNSFNVIQWNYFNPRAPCGARLAPEELGPRKRNFNPRAPCGARQIFKHISASSYRFQSTRPMRGAT